MGNGHSSAVENIGVVLGGIVIGAIAGSVCYPMTALTLQWVFDITDPHGPITTTPDGPVEYGVGTAGYWASWIGPFLVFFALGIAGSIIRRTRLLGITVTISFMVFALALGSLIVSFDFGGAPHPD